MTVGDEPAFVSVEGLRHSIITGEPGYNYCLNPSFNLWSKGNSFSGYVSSTADCWRIYSLGGTQSVSRYSINDKISMAGIVTTADVPNSTANLHTDVENVNTFAGKPIVFSFEIACAVEDVGKTIRVSVDQHFGTGGTPSPVVQQDTYIKMLSTRQRYICNFDMPTVEGKTFGSNNNSKTIFTFIWSSKFYTRVGLQTFSYKLSDVKIEIGNYFTGFKLRPIQDDINLCSRYIQDYKMNGLSMESTVTGISTQHLLIPYRPMYTLPTVTAYFYNNNGPTPDIRNGFLSFSRPTTQGAFILYQVILESFMG